MNLQVINVSNQLARNNSVYLSTLLAKDPNKSVRVKISGKIFKCCFLKQQQKKYIGMSKNLRTYLNTDVGKQIKVQPVDQQYDINYDLSYLQLQIDQLFPKLTTKTKIEDIVIITALHKKQNQNFFNSNQVKYIQMQDITYTLKTNKIMFMMTGQTKVPVQAPFGKLISQTEVVLKSVPGSFIQVTLQGGQANIFRPDFKLQDMGIGGLDEELFNIFRRTFASRRYSNAVINRFGIKHVKGILLYGPPGTGKTLIARQLARALNVKDLKIVNGPQIFSKFVGQSQENIRKLFAQARADQNKLGDKSPLHIIVFDQIDAICKQRGMQGGVGGQVSDQVVNQLLTNIDGVQALNNIIVIGMTNRKDLLDEAILRPGRFQVHIQVNLPNVQGRQQIINIHTKNLKNNNLLDSQCKLDDLARITKNFTGAEIQALVKCASSHAISRTTNILDFSKELKIDQSKLKVQMQDFLKALEEVKPQFGVDQEKFGVYYRQKVINYGHTYQKTVNSLKQVSEFGQKNCKRSILLYGKAGTGKTTLVMNFLRHTSFNYLKIISPQNLVGQTQQQKIRNINKIFQDAYKTTSACILVDGIQRIIQFSSIGIRYSNSILQALLSLLQKIPPKQSCKLLIIGTTSSYYQIQNLDINSRFDLKVSVPLLNQEQIQNLLRQKYNIQNGNLLKQVSSLVKGCNIRNLIDLAQLVENKNNFSEWQDYWHNYINFKSGKQIEIQEQQ